MHWRVRAIRDLYGGVLNKLPAVSYGPWSPTFTSTNPPLVTGSLTPDESISDVTSTAADPAAHHVVPGFAFSGDTGLDVQTTGLYRAYVATDSDCLNVVFHSAIVGSPAYPPRWNGTLELPTTPATSIPRASAGTCTSRRSRCPTSTPSTSNSQGGQSSSRASRRSSP